MRLTSQIAIALLAALVSSKAIKLERSDPALNMKLFAKGNTLVKAVLTNTGASDVNLLNKGTFLDKAAVEKLTVSSDSKSQLFTISTLLSTLSARQDRQGYDLCARLPCDTRHACPLLV